MFPRTATVSCGGPIRERALSTRRTGARWTSWPATTPPVFATFQIAGFKQYVSDAAAPGIGLSSNNKAQIVIDRCQAKVNMYIPSY